MLSNIPSRTKGRCLTPRRMFRDGRTNPISPTHASIMNYGS